MHSQGGYRNRGGPFQTDVVTTFTVGERSTIAALSWGVDLMRVGDSAAVSAFSYRDKALPGLVPPKWP